ncbi:MAG TPA: hypothetical protein PKD91_07065 [Bacteroidia bacterium]|nr:hypothetical protein [Bacteroidia bacterium]
MKKNSLLILTIICSLPFLANSQDVRLNLYTGYVFDNRFDSYYDAYNYYEGKIEGGFQWGGGIEVAMKGGSSFEAMYIRQDTKAPTTYLNGGTFNDIDYANFDLALNYIMIGGGSSLKTSNSKVEAYGKLMAGMVVAGIDNPVNGKSSSATKFAWGLKGGANIWVTESIGIKMQAQLLSAVQSVGGSFYFGTGGSGAGLSAYSSLYQFTIGGGLAIKFPTGAKK